MSPKDYNDWRKTDRAKDKIKLPKKKDSWSRWADDNPRVRDDSVDEDPDNWLDIMENKSNE